MTHTGWPDFKHPLPSLSLHPIFEKFFCCIWYSLIRTRSTNGWVPLYPFFHRHHYIISLLLSLSLSFDRMKISSEKWMSSPPALKQTDSCLSSAISLKSFCIKNIDPILPYFPFLLSIPFHCDHFFASSLSIHPLVLPFYTFNSNKRRITSVLECYCCVLLNKHSFPFLRLNSSCIVKRDEDCWKREEMNKKGRRGGIKESSYDIWTLWMDSLHRFYCWSRCCNTSDPLLKCYVMTFVYVTRPVLRTVCTLFVKGRRVGRRIKIGWESEFWG